MSRRDALIEQCKTEPEKVVDMLLLLEARIAALEKRINKNSQNSDKPPSSDKFAKAKSRKKKSSRKSGAQKGHPGRTLKFSETPDKIIPYSVPNCTQCGNSLNEAEGHIASRRQEIELPENPVEVIEHQAIQKCCPCCQHQNVGELPSHLRGNVQYGRRFKALCTYLMNYQLIPYERTSELMETLCGYKPGGGTLQSILEHAYTTLEPIEKHTKAKLKHSDVAYTDETGARVDSSPRWVHVFSTNDYTYYFYSRYRGHIAHLEKGLIPDYRGILMHDAYSTYFKPEYHFEHALCNAHLLRELTAIYEDDDEQLWAVQLDQLLRDAWAIVKKAKQDGYSQLPTDTLNKIQEQFDQIIAPAHQQNPHAQRKPGQRGRVGQSDVRNLLDRLIDYKEAYLRFALDFRVSFDNNLAERDLRMIKVHQKVSASFRTEHGADIFCRIKGYISTLRKQNHDIITALASLWLPTPFVPVPAE